MRHTNVDGCPSLGLRINSDRSIYQSNTFAHAREAKPSTLLCCLNIEPTPYLLGVGPESRKHPYDFARWLVRRRDITHNPRF